MTNRLFVCGDTHIPHDIQKLNTRNFPEQKELTKDDVLVQLGDFGGIWYPLLTNKEQEYWLEWLVNKKFTTAVVLGNHENYDVIETLPWTTKWGNDVQYWGTNEEDRVYFLKRGAIYDIGGRKILAIGGANSIDKAHRTEGVSWWKQEDISYAETESCFNELAEKGYDLDYVLTHTCPSSIIEEFLWMTPYNSGKKHCHTAEFLDEIYNRIEFKSWHFGHMHMDYVHIEKYDDDTCEDHFQCHYNGVPHELI